MSTPYQLSPSRQPAPPRPTPTSVTGYTFSNSKPGRAPISNPYDKFTQPQFDAWIGNITGSLKRALGHDEVPSQSTEDIITPSGVAQAGDIPQYKSIDLSDYSEDEAVDETFAEIKARRAVGKGKARDPREGPGLGKTSVAQPIEIPSSDEDEEGEVEYSILVQSDSDAEGEAEDGEEYEDEDETAEDYPWTKAASSSHVPSSPQKGLLSPERRATNGINVDEYEDEEDEEEEAEYEEYDEEGDSEAEDVEEANPEDEIIEIISDDDEPSLQTVSRPGLSTTRGYEAEDDNMHYGEDEDDEYEEEEYELEEYKEERDEESENDEYSDVEDTTTVQGGKALVHAPEYAEYISDDDDEIEEVQPLEDDTSFPPIVESPPKFQTKRGVSVEIPDRWDGPRTYAQDFYSGGDVELSSERMEPSVLGAGDEVDKDIVEEMPYEHLRAEQGTQLLDIEETLDNQGNNGIEFLQADEGNFQPPAGIFHNEYTTTTPFRELSFEREHIQTPEDNYIQPSDVDTSFPAQHDAAEDPMVQIPDLWDGPRTYAEDFYTGGDVHAGAHMDADHLVPEDEDPIKENEARREQDILSDQVQPPDQDTAFLHDEVRGGAVEIHDNWEGPETYAEDYYSGGAVVTMPNEHVDASMLSGTGNMEDDYSSFLTPPSQIAEAEADALPDYITEAEADAQAEAEGEYEDDGDGDEDDDTGEANWALPPAPKDIYIPPVMRARDAPIPTDAEIINLDDSDDEVDDTPIPITEFSQSAEERKEYPQETPALEYVGEDDLYSDLDVVQNGPDARHDQSDEVPVLEYVDQDEDGLYSDLEVTKDNTPGLNVQGADATRDDPVDAEMESGDKIDLYGDLDATQAAVSEPSSHITDVVSNHADETSRLESVQKNDLYSDLEDHDGVFGADKNYEDVSPSQSKPEIAEPQAEQQNEVISSPVDWNNVNSPAFSVGLPASASGHLATPSSEHEDVMDVGQDTETTRPDGHVGQDVEISEVNEMFEGEDRSTLYKDAEAPFQLVDFEEKAATSEDTDAPEEAVSASDPSIADAPTNTHEEIAAASEVHEATTSEDIDYDISVHLEDSTVATSSHLGQDDHVIDESASALGEEVEIVVTEDIQDEEAKVSSFPIEAEPEVEEVTSDIGSRAHTEQPEPIDYTEETETWVRDDVVVGIAESKENTLSPRGAHVHEILTFEEIQVHTEHIPMFDMDPNLPSSTSSPLAHHNKWNFIDEDYTDDYSSSVEVDELDEEDSELPATDVPSFTMEASTSELVETDAHSSTHVEAESLIPAPEDITPSSPARDIQADSDLHPLQPDAFEDDVVPDTAMLSPRAENIDVQKESRMENSSVKEPNTETDPPSSSTPQLDCIHDEEANPELSLSPGLQRKKDEHEHDEAAVDTSPDAPRDKFKTPTRGFSVPLNVTPEKPSMCTDLLYSTPERYTPPPLVMRPQRSPVSSPRPDSNAHASTSTSNEARESTGSQEAAGVTAQVISPVLHAQTHHPAMFGEAPIIPFHLREPTTSRNISPPPTTTSPRVFMDPHLEALRNAYTHSVSFSTMLANAALRPNFTYPPPLNTMPGYSAVPELHATGIPELPPKPSSPRSKSYPYNLSAPATMVDADIKARKRKRKAPRANSFSRITPDIDDEGVKAYRDASDLEHQYPDSEQGTSGLIPDRSPSIDELFDVRSGNPQTAPASVAMEEGVHVVSLSTATDSVVDTESTIIEETSKIDEETAATQAQATTSKPQSRSKTETATKSKRVYKRKRDTSPEHESTSVTDKRGEGKSSKPSKAKRKSKLLELEGPVSSPTNGETVYVKPRAKETAPAQAAPAQGTSKSIHPIRGASPSKSKTRSPSVRSTHLFGQNGPRIIRGPISAVAPAPAVDSLLHAHGSRKRAPMPSFAAVTRPMHGSSSELSTIQGLQQQPIPSDTTVSPTVPPSSQIAKSDEAAESSSLLPATRAKIDVENPTAAKTSPVVVTSEAAPAQEHTEPPDADTISTTQTPSILSPAPTVSTLSIDIPRNDMVPAHVPDTPSARTRVTRPGKGSTTQSGTPSTITRATRSHCRYHRISLPKEEGGPRVRFLVPGCALTNDILMKEAEIEDHGEAPPEDAHVMIRNIESLNFGSDLVGILRVIIGHDIFRDQAVFYLPSPGEQLSLKPSYRNTPTAEKAGHKAGESYHKAGSPSFSSFSGSPTFQRASGSVAGSSSSLSGLRRSMASSEKGADFVPTDSEDELDDDDAHSKGSHANKGKSRAKSGTSRLGLDAHFEPLQDQEEKASNAEEADKSNRKRRKSTGGKRSLKRARTDVTAEEDSSRHSKKLKAHSTAPLPQSPEKPSVHSAVVS